MRLATTILIAILSLPLSATALAVVPASGGWVSYPYWYTGNGLGFAMGAFEIENPHTQGLVLYDITLTANGSGDDSTGLSEIGLFVDANTNGSYEPGTDVRYGPVYSAYPSDNGSLTFSETIGFAPSAITRFIIVGKLNGTVLPTGSKQFLTNVSSITATGGQPTGLPTGLIPGVGVIGGSTPLRLEYDVTGAGPPYDYTFRWVLDNHDNSWVGGQEWKGPVFGQAAFGNGGTTPFNGWATNAASYPIGPFTQTFWSSVTVAGLSYDGPVLYGPSAADWTPSFIGDELVWWGTANTFLNEGEMSWTSSVMGGPTVPGSASIESAHRVGDYLRVDAVPGTSVDVGPTITGGGNGFVIGAFDVIGHTAAATLGGVTLTASGTGDDSTAFSDIRLFVDVNSNGVYDPGVDTQFGAAASAYPVDDGSLTFNGTLNFSPDETWRMLVVAQLNGPVLATYGQTFNTTVTAISASGNMHSGLPTVLMPGIHISAPTLTLAASGSPQSVLPDAQGPGGIGVQAAEFLISNNTVGTANLDSITVAAAGAMFDNTDFSSVALYEDTNTSGTYDAADTLYVTAATAFPNDDGSLTFAQATTFAPGQSRLFFLVVKLDLAQTGDDFWSRVTTLGISGGTEVNGAPSELIHGLTILPGVPQIAVTRGGAVANGGTDTLPPATAGVAQLLTYTISNPGSASLDLTGTPLVQTAAGVNVLSVSVTVLPAATIGAKASTTFTVSYTATSPGAFDFTVSIASTDTANSPYTWTATGTAAAPGGGDGGADGGSSNGGCSTGGSNPLAWLLVVGSIAAGLAAIRQIPRSRA